MGGNQWNLLIPPAHDEDMCQPCQKKIQSLVGGQGGFLIWVVGLWARSAESGVSGQSSDSSRGGGICFPLEVRIHFLKLSGVICVKRASKWFW